MGRGRCALGVAVVGGLLALGPWPGALVPPAERAEAAPDVPVVTEVSSQAAFGRAEAEPVERRESCGCEEVVVNASNVVRDSTIRSGDAKVENFNLTYISRGYIEKVKGDIEVKIRQRASARTGDAMGGQTIGVAASSPRCLNVVVRAVNIVEDTEVRSGDATAVNRNIVLLDPGVAVDDLELKVRQRASAESGQASAGQIIGVAAETAGRCGTGSVTIEAVNRTSNVDVRTGAARAENRNSVIGCGEVGCAAELARYLGRADSVLMCTSSGCRQVSAEKLAAELGIELRRPEPPPWMREVAPEFGSIPVPSPFGPASDQDPGEDGEEDEPKTKRPREPTPTPVEPEDDPVPDDEAGESEDDEEPEPTPTPTPAPESGSANERSA